MPPPVPNHARVALRTLRPLAGYLRHIGEDPARLFAELGIDPLGLFDSNASIPHPLLLDIWRRAEERCNDPDLGLRVLARIDIRLLERLPHETEWIVLQMFVASATLRDALARFARYFPISFYGSEIVVDCRDRAVHVRHIVLGAPRVPRSFSEFIVGLLARSIYELTARPVKPREIRFVHPPPPSTEEAERILPAPVRYSTGEDVIVLGEADLDVPLRTPNAALIPSLERHGDELLAKLPPLESFLDRVRALIAAELGGGNPNAEHIARSMQMSVRTLARRLEELGTSHKALLDEVRASLARRYLVEDRRLVSDVATLLGFSEVSAFHRAFRRWYGCSPTDFRREADAGER